MNEELFEALALCSSGSLGELVPVCKRTLLTRKNVARTQRMHSLEPTLSSANVNFSELCFPERLERRLVSLEDI